MQQVIMNGSFFAALGVALLAGLVTFFSPCILPVVPGYLGYVAGSAAPRSRAVTGALLFVAGFTLVFVLLTTVSGFLGSIFSMKVLIEQIFGVIVILLGFVMMGMTSFLQRTIKPDWRPRLGLGGAPFLGMAFAFGWTPCIGPTLGTVMMLSTQQATALNAVTLGIAFSIGLGLPFVTVAAGFGWMTRSVGFVKRHMRAFNIVGGLMLIVVGLIMATGNWDWITAKFMEVIGGWITYTPTI